MPAVGSGRAASDAAAARICGVTSMTWPSTPLTKPGDSSVDSPWPARRPVDGHRLWDVVGVQQF